MADKQWQMNIELRTDRMILVGQQHAQLHMVKAKSNPLHLPPGFGPQERHILFSLHVLHLVSTFYLQMTHLDSIADSVFVKIG